MKAEIFEAIAAASDFTLVLKKDRQNGWVSKFLEIVRLLEKGEVNVSVHEQQQFSYADPGSLSDIIAEDETSFSRSWGSVVSRKMRLGALTNSLQARRPCRAVA